MECGFKEQVMHSANRDTQGWRMLIGGEWVESRSGKRYTTLNPAYDTPLAEVPDAQPEDVEAAAEAASTAFPKWKKLDMEERVKILRRFSSAIRERAEEFGMLDALDSGNPYLAMVNDTRRGADFFDYFLGLGMELKGQTIPTSGGGLNYTRMEPYGVVGLIIPFNHPIYFAVGKIAAPLVAGNTVILKPAEQTPLSALLLGKIAQDVLPPGVLNIITGGGAQCGAPLVSHPKVRRIAFTGGVETGRRIVQQAGIKSVTLELGGKNPLIIFPDADVEKAAAAAVAGMNFMVCQGQSCGSNSRVFVHHDLRQPFLEAVLEKVREIRIGLPELEETQMGPVITRQHYERMKTFIQSGRNEGAELLCGGGHPRDEALRNGYFIEPTVFDGVKHGMTIEKKEIFGPIMGILSWDDEASMLQEVNDTEYGLTANIWTNDISRALRLADEIESGYIWINGHGGKRYIGAPFGGYKDSGMGRENSFDELISYTQVKNVNIRY